MVIYLRWIANIAILILAITLLCLFEFGILPTYKAGFYCNDRALSFIPGEETVTDVVLCTISAFVPILLIIFNEMAVHVSDNDGYSFSKFLKNINSSYIWLRGYFQGLALGLAIMEIIKFTIGTPRPTFLEVCMPDKAVGCSDGAYVQYFECTNTNNYSFHTVIDNNRSFLSGHTMVSVYMALFLFWYLQHRCKGPWLWPFLLQIIAFIWAIVASLSRISDHRHHWWDVVGGFVLAVFLSAYAVQTLCNNFQQDSANSTQFIRYLQEKLIRDKNQDFVNRNNIV